MLSGKFCAVRSAVNSKQDLTASQHRRDLKLSLETTARSSVDVLCPSRLPAPLARAKSDRRRAGRPSCLSETPRRRCIGRSAAPEANLLIASTRSLARCGHGRHVDDSASGPSLTPAPTLSLCLTPPCGLRLASWPYHARCPCVLRRPPRQRPKTRLAPCPCYWPPTNRIHWAVSRPSRPGRGLPSLPWTHACAPCAAPAAATVHVSEPCCCFSVAAARGAIVDRQLHPNLPT